MKNLLTAFLPALALLALGGCASTAGLATSEDDGVYYSSQDRTTAVVRTAPAAAARPTAVDSDEATNPDYNGNTASAPARQSSGSDQYYDDSYNNTYTYMRGVPNYGVTYYTPYSPYTSINYAWGVGGGCGFSPYGICDPFFSPFYSPFGYGSGISIGLGFGSPWGYGGGFNGYGRPYGFGYGGGFYDPFYFNSPFYGGYYGRGGYYGNRFYGSNYGYGNHYSGNEPGRNYRAPGHRNNRASDGRYTTGGSSLPNGAGSNPGGVTTTGRARTEGRLMPNTPQPSAPAPSEGRMRSESVTATQLLDDAPTTPTDGYNKPRRQQSTGQPMYRDMNQPTEQGQVTRENSRSLGRGLDATPQATDPATPQPAQPEAGQRRRGGFFQNVTTQPSPAAEQQPQPARRRADQQTRQRAYEQPRQQSYEQPRQQSYEPQRSSQPSYSPPSNSGGGRGRGRSN